MIRVVQVYLLEWQLLYNPLSEEFLSYGSFSYFIKDILYKYIYEEKKNIQFDILEQFIKLDFVCHLVLE